MRVSAPEPRPVVREVLLVEDDHVDQSLIGRLLRSRHDLELRCVDDLGAAEVAIAEREPGVVLLDLLLPGGDGLDLLTRLPEAERSFPIVILTGQGTQQVAVAAMKAGAADYLVKGAIDGERLTTTIDNAVARHRAERERMQAIAALERSTRSNRSLLACAQTLLLDLFPRRTLTTALDGLARHIEADGLSLWTHVRGRRLPDYRRLAASGIAEHRDPVLVFEPDLVRWHLALSCGESLLIVASELTVEELAAIGRADGDQLAVVPFYRDGRWVGALIAERVGPGAVPFGSEEQFFLQGAGDMLTAWLERRTAAESA